MRIEWLNADCTEALVTKSLGFFRKRYLQATLKLVDLRYPSLNGSWQFQPSGNTPGRDLAWALHESRKAEIERQRVDQDWQPVRALPPARVVERKS